LVRKRGTAYFFRMISEGKSNTLPSEELLSAGESLYRKRSHSVKRGKQIDYIQIP
jgi:hypothetical protein